MTSEVQLQLLSLFLFGNSEDKQTSCSGQHDLLSVKQYRFSSVGPWGADKAGRHHQSMSHLSISITSAISRREREMDQHWTKNFWEDPGSCCRQYETLSDFTMVTWYNISYYSNSQIQKPKWPVVWYVCDCFLPPGSCHSCTWWWIRAWCDTTSIYPADWDPSPTHTHAHASTHTHTNTHTHTQTHTHRLAVSL